MEPSDPNRHSRTNEKFLLDPTVVDRLWIWNRRDRTFPHGNFSSKPVFQVFQNNFSPKASALFGFCRSTSDPVARFPSMSGSEQVLLQRQELQRKSGILLGTQDRNDAATCSNRSGPPKIQFWFRFCRWSSPCRQTVCSHASLAYLINLLTDEWGQMGEGGVEPPALADPPSPQLPWFQADALCFKQLKQDDTVSRMLTGLMNAALCPPVGAGGESSQSTAQPGGSQIELHDEFRNSWDQMGRKEEKFQSAASPPGSAAAAEAKKNWRTNLTLTDSSYRGHLWFWFWVRSVFLSGPEQFLLLFSRVREL